MDDRRARNTPIRVVIIDDEQMFVDALRSLLALEDGIEVVAATTDPRTLPEIACDADIVLMDLILPGADGLELTRNVRAEHPAQQVIVISGRGDHEAEREALEAGAAAFLMKGGLHAGVGETIREVARLRGVRQR